MNFIISCLLLSRMSLVEMFFKLIHLTLWSIMAASMCVIHSLYKYFSSMDNIHRLKGHLSFFKWMTLLTMDKIFSSMDDFDGWKFHPWIKSCHLWMAFLVFIFWGWKLENSVSKPYHENMILMILTQKHDSLKFHTWMKNPILG